MGHQYVYHVLLISLTKSANSVLVQGLKWLVDASSILL